MSGDIVVTIDLNHHECWDAAVPAALVVACAGKAKMRLVVAGGRLPA